MREISVAKGCQENVNASASVKGILKRIKKISSGKKVLINSKAYRYKSVEEKYIATLKEYESCTDEQLELIEIQLKTHLETARQFKEYGDIVPLFVSMVALMFTGIIPFLVESLSEWQADLLTKMESVALGALFICVLAVFLFWGIHRVYSTCTNVSYFLLNVLQIYREKKAESEVLSTHSVTKKAFKKVNSKKRVHAQKYKTTCSGRS